MIEFEPAKAKIIDYINNLSNQYMKINLTNFFIYLLDYDADFLKNLYYHSDLDPLRSRFYTVDFNFSYQFKNTTIFMKMHKNLKDKFKNDHEWSYWANRLIINLFKSKQEERFIDSYFKFFMPSFSSAYQKSFPLNISIGLKAYLDELKISSLPSKYFTNHPFLGNYHINQYKNKDTSFEQAKILFLSRMIYKAALENQMLDFSLLIDDYSSPFYGALIEELRQKDKLSYSPIPINNINFNNYNFYLYPLDQAKKLTFQKINLTRYNFEQKLMFLYENINYHFLNAAAPSQLDNAYQDFVEIFSLLTNQPSHLTNAEKMIIDFAFTQKNNCYRRLENLSNSPDHDIKAKQLLEKQQNYLSFVLENISQLSPFNSEVDQFIQVIKNKNKNILLKEDIDKFTNNLLKSHIEKSLNTKNSNINNIKPKKLKI